MTLCRKHAHLPDSIKDICDFNWAKYRFNAKIGFINCNMSKNVELLFALVKLSTGLTDF